MHSIYSLYLEYLKLISTSSSWPRSGSCPLSTNHLKESYLAYLIIHSNFCLIFKTHLTIKKLLWPLSTLQSGLSDPLLHLANSKSSLWGHHDCRVEIVCFLAWVLIMPCTCTVLLSLSSQTSRGPDSQQIFIETKWKSSLIKHVSALPTHFTSFPATLGNRKEKFSGFKDSVVNCTEKKKKCCELGWPGFYFQLYH